MKYLLELVSKELNHFGGITSFFQDWALGTLTDGEYIFVYVPPASVSGAQSWKNNVIPPKWFNSLDTNSTSIPNLKSKSVPEMIIAHQCKKQ